MDPQRQIIDWLQQDSARMAALRTVRRLGLNDWCLGAGFVRNLVWDRRHGYVEPTPLNDIDVIHFDAQRADAERDRMLEARLQQWLPQPWSVKNQARMHLRGGRAPYRNSEEAISFWTEVETAVRRQPLAVERLMHRVARLGMGQAEAQQLVGRQTGAGAPQRDARVGKGAQRIPTVDVNRFAHVRSPCSASNSG